MEWPWPEHKATPAVFTWGGCHRRPSGGRSWASSTPTPLPRCLFPWSAPSAETRLTRLRGLRSETGLGASTGGALTASRRLVPGRHGGVTWPTPIGADPGARSDYARRAIESSALPRRAYGGRASDGTGKASASCLAARAASASSAQPSCVASTELLVCATATHETHYCPCETPVQNEAAMPFLEAG